MMCGAVFATGLISRGDGSKPGEVTCAWPDDADEISNNGSTILTQEFLISRLISLEI